MFWMGSSPALALSLAKYGLLLLIALIGGRVIPFFTERALTGHLPRRLGWLEGMCLAGLFLSALAENWPGFSPTLKLTVLSLTAQFRSGPEGAPALGIVSGLRFSPGRPLSARTGLDGLGQPVGRYACSNLRLH